MRLAINRGYLSGKYGNSMENSIYGRRIEQLLLLKKGMNLPCRIPQRPGNISLNGKRKEGKDQNWGLTGSSGSHIIFFPTPLAGHSHLGTYNTEKEGRARQTKCEKSEGLQRHQKVSRKGSSEKICDIHKTPSSFK